MLRKSWQTIRELFFNFNTGMISFMIHRVTGIALVFYLVLHIITISAYRRGPEAFNASIAKYDNPFGHFLEYLLLLAVLTHLLNGVRITLVDFFNLSRFQERMFLWCVIIFLLVALYSIRVFFPELFITYRT